jgi:hypothetical protein
LDPFSVPVLNSNAPDFVTYIKLRPKDAVVAGMVGLQCANDVSSDVSVFNVQAEDTAGDFMLGTDIITVGQIAVQLSGPNRTPNPLRIWDVEPNVILLRFEYAFLYLRDELSAWPPLRIPPDRKSEFVGEKKPFPNPCLREPTMACDRCRLAHAI